MIAGTLRWRSSSQTSRMQGEASFCSRPSRVDPAREKALGDEVQNAGAADALRRQIADGPITQAVVRADLHAADRPRLRPHAGMADRALQRGPGRARAHEQKVPAAQHQLAVRADVEKQRQILPRVQIRLQQPARDVAAQIIGDRGHAVDISADGQSQLRRPDHAGVKKHRRVRALKHEPRVAAEEEVQHRRVAADGHGGDRLRADICRPAAGIDHAAHVRKRQRL